jgi:hypothetical protein
MRHDPHNHSDNRLIIPTEDWKAIPLKLALVLTSAAVGFGVAWEIHRGATFARTILDGLATATAVIADNLRMITDQFLR